MGSYQWMWRSPEANSSDGYTLRLIERLQRTTQLLDQMLLEAEITEHAGQDAAVCVLRPLEQVDVTEGVRILVRGLKENPFWLRGYLLLAIIYQEVQAAQEAVVALQLGARVCEAGLRYLGRQLATLATSGLLRGELPTPVVRRISLLMRYEELLRHHLAQVLVEAGRFDEALQWWEPDASRGMA